VTTERWRLIKSAFQQSLEVAEERRAAWLAETFAGDADLRADVESLLQAHARAGQFLEEPAAADAAWAAESPAPGELLGVYRVVQRIGEGGMSVVYQAVRDDDEFRRLVAIKILKRGMDTDFLVRRFRKERQILAHFDHPNIAKIFDGGSTPDGRPYFVMEFIAGTPIDAYCDRRKLSVRERLNLFLRVSNGVEYAHQNLVVHRDLKPSNILVTEDGHPKLLDFGIAKLLEDDRDMTASYMRLMTPAYASPEQIAGAPITTRSDIYSLGVILFELLTGQKPYELRGRSVQAAREAMAGSDPPRPSTVALRGGERIAELRSTRPERLRRMLRDDLDSIVAMAMRPEPTDRYAAVGQMAADIRRHFAGETIVARQGSFGYKARKFLRRHRLVAGATAAVILALAAGVVVANWQRRVAERRFDLVRALANSMLYEVHDAIVPLAGSTGARELIVRRAQEYLDRLSAEGDGGPLEREHAEAYLRIGDVLGNPAGPNLGDAKGALDNYRRALELSRRLAASAPGDSALRAALAAGHQRVCAVENRMGDFRSALGNCAEAVRLQEEIAAAEGGNARVDLGYAYDQMAEPYFSLGEWDRAREFRTKALGVYEALAAREPANDRWRMQIAQAHHFLAGVEEQSGRFALGLGHAEHAVAGFEEYSAAHPDDAAAQLQPTFALQRLGSLRIALGDLKGALAAFEKALPVRERLLALDPRDARARLNLLRSHNSIGFTLVRLGEPSRALEHFQVEEKLARELVDKDPTPVEHQTSLATAHENVGSVWLYYAERASQPGEQRRYWQRARTYFAQALAIAGSLQARGALKAEYVVIHERLKAELAACNRALGLHVSSE
jgi:non-specific serine/threonine protein kinase/serine/threonine-protein kinase